ncbi:MAG: hypothetical protein GFH27_549309n50 [Chloroflexi bacterium AL-W]|nr:hypothetical protein [Chloroflexi bacterium AL-N1]NOK69753.1 hypothetical protein [Chloroflexi bacterium AL-N10]NOK73643.1 hypothetical protein [Chloroflexi bacterium AL-N5]NOK83923.1 hypothetical protein [Chloroflexi bacterium AL-W]NOK87974.1 hypothetical protein [Chloroflexi bacterium AL-N15]
MKNLFTKVTDLSNRTNTFTKLADHLLSRVAPQQEAAGSNCVAIGCCSDGRGKFRCYVGTGSYIRCGNPTCW